MFERVSKMLLGDSVAFAADPLGFVEEHVLGQPGPVYARFANRSAFFIARPEGVKHVLVDAADRYGKGSQQARLRPLFGDGLITASGDRWEHARLAARPGTTGQEMDRGINLALGVLIREMTRQAYRFGQEINTHELAGRLTMRMAAAALFHHELDEPTADRAYRAALFVHHRLSEAMWRLIDFDTVFPTAKRQKFQAAVQEMEMIAGQIAKEPKGVLAGLASLQERFGPNVLRDESITMLIAGFETTAQVTAWLLYALASRPDLVAWIREEVDPFLAYGRDLDHVKLKELHRTRAVVDEVARLYPSTWWFAREALVDDELSGVKIPKGSMIFICPWVLHRQPDLWPDAQAFKPERFLERAPAKFTYVPFGVGARTCIGMHLARSEMVAIAAYFTAAFDLAPLSGALESLKPVGGVTLATPEQGLTVRFQPRKRITRRVA